MRIFLITGLIIFALAADAAARETQRVFSWTDENGVRHYGDSIPAEYADAEKHVLNEHGVTVDTLRGKKTAEEIAEEKRQLEAQRKLELRRQQDQALMATYMSIEEIVMHRDRRIELFQAQTRVTELYLRNLNRRLDKLMGEAAVFQPYSEDPEAPMIDPDLSEDITTTRETIARHEGNLKRFEIDEQDIRKRFEIDINRFKELKGLDKQAATTPQSPD